MTTPERSQPPPLPGASAPVITPPPLPVLAAPPPLPVVPDGATPDLAAPDVETPDLETPDLETADVEDSDVETADAVVAQANPVETAPDDTDVTPPRLPTVGVRTEVPADLPPDVPAEMPTVVPRPPVPPLPEPAWYPVGPGFTAPTAFPPLTQAQQPLAPAPLSSGQIQSFPRPHAPLFAPAQAPVYAPVYQDIGDVPRSERGRGASAAVTALAMVAAVLFVTAAGIGVWWTRSADTRAQSIAELKAEHSAFVEAQTAADSEVLKRYAAFDVPARWAAVVAANEKYAKTEEAFNAAYPTSQRTIPLSAGFALVSAVRQCLTPVLEYNRVAGQFSDEVRAGLPVEVDMASARTNCNVIGWTTAP